MGSRRISRSASLQESEKLECSASWEALDWTDIEPITKSDCSSRFEFLLESEAVIVKVFGVVLVNIDEAGTLLITTFRLIFLSEGTGNIVPLGTIPLASIEKCNKQTMKQSSVMRQFDKFTSRRLLQVIGKDMRVIVFGFRPRTKQRGTIYDALLKHARPTNVQELYAYNLGPSKFANSSPKMRLLNEYFRVLGKCSSTVSGGNMEERSFTFYNDHWRITDINSDYNVCATYPFAFLVPKHISDEEIIQASSFRARSRVPAVSWVHPETKAALARSSQPLIGFMNMRSNADEKLVGALCAQLCSSDGKRRKLYITDARPRKNSLANSAIGGGSESSANYLHSEVVFFGIDNIHAMRESLARLRDYLDTHGANSSDGISSFLRHGDWSWSGGNLSSMSASVGTLGDSGWLIHVQSVLAGSAWIAAHIALESASVLVHCSDGWDRTSQLVALASLLLDPYYRTLKGFQALVEKDWLAFGHPFADRIGMPTADGVCYELPRQSSGLSVSTPVRQTSVSVASQSPSSHSQALNNSSPIFVQWIDCVSQLLRIYPFAFEFSSCFLVDLLDLMLSCRFGNFLCNSEKERQKAGVFDSCGCLWAYMDDLRSSIGSSHSHYNSFYDPQRHDGPLLPPAAALAPTLWPQFHLRWACPSESRVGEVEVEYQNIAQKIHVLKKEKEAAERIAIEATTTAELLSRELQKEKKLCSSATNVAKKATKEATSMRRAIESLGCKITFSPTGDCIVDIENNLSTDGNSRVCEKTCPLRPRDGPCRWPEEGCVQFGSQLVGFKANFEAFDSLSICDTYFQFNPNE